MTYSPAAYEFRNEHPEFQEANKAVHAFCEKIQSEKRSIRYCLARIGTLDSIDDVVGRHMFSHDSISNKDDEMLEDITGINREVWMDKMCTGLDCIREMQMKVVHDIVRHENQIKKYKAEQEKAKTVRDAIEKRVLEMFENQKETKEKEKV